jgi:hypothetical protein
MTQQGIDGVQLARAPLSIELLKLLEDIELWTRQVSELAQIPRGVRLAADRLSKRATAELDVAYGVDPDGAFTEATLAGCEQTQRKVEEIGERSAAAAEKFGLGSAGTRGVQPDHFPEAGKMIGEPGRLSPDAPSGENGNG